MGSLQISLAAEEVTEDLGTLHIYLVGSTLTQLEMQRGHTAFTGKSIIHGKVPF